MSVKIAEFKLCNSFSLPLHAMEFKERKSKPTKFNTAIPLVLLLRDFIFGKNSPDRFTKFIVYTNLLIWLCFTAWHLISYFAISLRDLIFEEKKINVQELIFQRGIELGFSPYQFLNHILKYHFISIFAWGFVFVGLVLLWRKKKIFSFFIYIGLVAYVAILFLFMGRKYIATDVTFLDKIWVGYLFVSCSLAVFLRPYLNPNSQPMPSDEALKPPHEA